MAIGLRTFDKAGRLLFDSEERYSREYGIFYYDLSVSDQFVPVPEMVANDTTFIALFSSSGYSYEFKDGGVQLTKRLQGTQTGMWQPYVQGTMILLRY